MPPHWPVGVARLDLNDRIAEKIEQADLDPDQAALLEKLPNPMLTRDQVELLKTDNVVSGHAPGLDALGVTPTPLEVVLPGYLARFQRGGGYGHLRAAHR